MHRRLEHPSNPKATEPPHPGNPTRPPAAFGQYESRHLIPGFAAGTVSPSDDPAWASSGAASVDEYAFWSGRACGAACLRSILSTRMSDPPRTLPLVRELLRAGAYRVRPDGGVDGLIYAPFVTYLAARWGLAAEVRAPLELDGIVDAVGAGALVVASVHPAIRHAPRPAPGRGGHLVLVFGHDHGDLVFHNPSGLDAGPVRLPVGKFGRYFAGRGVTVHPGGRMHQDR